MLTPAFHFILLHAPMTLRFDLPAQAYTWIYTNLSDLDKYLYWLAVPFPQFVLFSHQSSKEGHFLASDRCE